MEPMTIRPSTGRVYRTVSPVRFGDCDVSGRLRLDAVARLVQDAGNDDFADAGLDPMSPWVARRSTVLVPTSWPMLGDRLEVVTWCGGIGSRWAERRATVSAPGGVVEVATLWVHVDELGRPARVPATFLDTYAEAAGDRVLSTRRRLAPPPPSVPSRPWPLRVTDLDVLGHVNNAVVWAAVEDACHTAGVEPAGGEVEFSAPLLVGDPVVLRAEVAERSLFVWLEVDGVVRVAAEVAAT